MQHALASYTASREIYAREQAEKRGYIKYDSYQKGIDREASQEPGLLVEVRDARDHCLESISTAIIRGIVFVALTKLVPFLYVVWDQGAFFTVVAGEIMRTVSLGLE
jgi:hypothetical protein